MKLVKKEIKKNIRWTLMFTTILLIGLTSISWYTVTRLSTSKENTQPTYNYQINSNVSYKVGLKANPIYDTETLNEGGIYISSFVDIIDTEFKYEFIGEEDSYIEGEYEVIAVMEANINEMDSSEIVWKKEYAIVPKDKFFFDGATAIIDNNISVNYEEYNNFKTSITQSYKFSTPVKMTVFMNVYLNNITEKGIMKKNTTSSIQFLLNNDYFEIEKTEVQEKPEVLQVTEQNGLGLGSNKNIAFISAIIILSAFLFYIIFFTKIIKISAIEKKLNKIFKNHGKRLVALSSGKPNNLEIVLKVLEIDDLVRIADELSKPIFYTYITNNTDSTEFYVIDGKQLYLYDLITSSE